MVTYLYKFSEVEYLCSENLNQITIYFMQNLASIFKKLVPELQQKKHHIQVPISTFLVQIGSDEKDVQ